MASIAPLPNMARLTALLRQTAQQSAHQPRSDPSATQAGTAAEENAIEASQLLRQQLLAVAKDAPQRQRTLARVWLEPLLIESFGPAMGLEPGFQAIVDDVLDALLRHPSLNADIDRITAHLMGEPERP